MKVLVIKRDKIGDLLLATPLLAALKVSISNIELHVLANSYNGWVVAENSNVDKLWLYPLERKGLLNRSVSAIRQFMLFLNLRAQNFNWIIVADGAPSPRANRRARFIGGKCSRIAAYCASNDVAGISDPLPEPTSGHQIERMLGLLRPMGVSNSVHTAQFPSFTPPTAWLVQARSFLAENKLEENHYLMLGIGARKRKRQPTARQLLNWTKAIYERHGLRTVFQWTPGSPKDPLYPGDDDIAEELLGGLSSSKLSWITPYRGGLETSIGLIWLAHFSVFPDSGLMHLAAASPGGVLGLFADIKHSPPPDIWGPVGNRTSIVIAEHAIADINDDYFIERLSEYLTPLNA